MLRAIFLWIDLIHMCRKFAVFVQDLTYHHASGQRFALPSVPLAPKPPAPVVPNIPNHVSLQKRRYTVELTINQCIPIFVAILAFHTYTRTNTCRPQRYSLYAIQSRGELWRNGEITWRRPWAWSKWSDSSGVRIHVEWEGS